MSDKPFDLDAYLGNNKDSTTENNTNQTNNGFGDNTNQSGFGGGGFGSEQVPGAYQSSYEQSNQGGGGFGAPNSFGQSYGDSNQNQNSGGGYGGGYGDIDGAARRDAERKARLREQYENGAAYWGGAPGGAPERSMYQPPPAHPRYKTRLCANFVARRRCPQGVNCIFAHGEEELNTPTRAPSERSDASRPS